MAAKAQLVSIWVLIFLWSSEWAQSLKSILCGQWGTFQSKCDFIRAEADWLNKPASVIPVVVVIVGLWWLTTQEVNKLSFMWRPLHPLNTNLRSLRGKLVQTFYTTTFKEFTFINSAAYPPYKLNYSPQKPHSCNSTTCRHQLAPVLCLITVISSNQL